ncbi:MAG: nucleotidyltransferase family protein [Alphaproteobacteria bacterium]|nr:nucleotidyltransferase family protein [Alphaproteobacteria bacterium]MDD9919864.1 nucleotidyltransferase family protein [Alphaproteobacteria bacterium]
MRVIILAGGFGTRLKTVVSDVPKPMAPIAGVPFLERQMRYMLKFGVTEFTLSVHHQHEKIEAHFGDTFESIPITYALEEEPLGTGGGIVFAMRTSSSEEPILVLNGDSFIEMDYAAIYQQHCASDTSLTMALRHIPDTSRSGIVTLEGDTITSFGERGEAGVSGLINAGVYAITPCLFEDYQTGQAFSFEYDFMQQKAPDLEAVGYLTDGYFIDIGVPDDYARAQTELPPVLAA